jgi:hypothetical protein
MVGLPATITALWGSLSWHVVVPPPVIQVGEGDEEFHQPHSIYVGASWVVYLQVGWSLSPLEWSNMVGLPATITALWGSLSWHVVVPPPMIQVGEGDEEFHRRHWYYPQSRPLPLILSTTKVIRHRRHWYYPTVVIDIDRRVRCH